jgi:dephospho-CoA kinase
MLIGIVGLNGSGKDTVAKYLVESYGFEWVSLSNMVRLEVIAQGKNVSNRDDLNFVAEDTRKKFGPDIWIKKSLKGYSKEKKLVLSSFRHPSENRIVKENNGVMIFVDVPIELRFKRTQERVLKDPKDHGSISFEDFKKKEERELVNIDKDKMQMGECIKLFDYKVDNSTTLDNLYSQIDKIMQKLGSKKI